MSLPTRSLCASSLLGRRRRRAAASCIADVCFFFFQAEGGIRDYKVTGVQTCALPIYRRGPREAALRGASPGQACRSFALPAFALMSRSTRQTGQAPAPQGLVSSAPGESPWEPVEDEAEGGEVEAAAAELREITVDRKSTRL